MVRGYNIEIWYRNTASKYSIKIQYRNTASRYDIEIQSSDTTSRYDIEIRQRDTTSKYDIENFNFSMRPMLPLEVVIRSLNFLMMYSKNLFSLLPSKVRFDQRIEGARCARTELHLENLTGFMLAPEVKQLADFGFLPNDRPIKTF